MFEVPLSDEAVALLRELAKKIGKTPEEFARRAILDAMEDLGDACLAEERNRTDSGERICLAEMMERYAGEVVEGGAPDGV